MPKKPTPSSPFGQIVVYLIESSGLEIPEVSEDLGIHEKTLYGIWYGTHGKRPFGGTRNKLCEWSGLTRAELKQWERWIEKGGEVGEWYESRPVRN